MSSLAVAADYAQEREDALQELEAITAELRRRRFREDPVYWAEQRLGVTLWSAQKRVMRSVAVNRRTAVKSCHGVGKSFDAATITAWWLDPEVHAPGTAVVVTSAPTFDQVKAVLWKEINHAHAKGNLAGRTNQTEWWMEVVHENGAVTEERVAFGRKPSNLNPAAFQGIHAPFVLVIFDEACGIHKDLWEPADSLLASEFCKFLAVGNPDDSDTEFATICEPGSGWHVETISAFDTPNFTGEDIPDSIKSQLISYTYVEEKRKKWAKRWAWNAERTRVLPPKLMDGEDLSQTAGPVWWSKVLGQFPQTKEGGLIPLPWIYDAMERDLSKVSASLPAELGVDVGAGGDSSTVCRRKGGMVRIVHEDHNPDTMQTTGKVVRFRKLSAARAVKVDVIGIGKGVVDRGLELGEPFTGINVGNSPVCNCEDLRTRFRRPTPQKMGKTHYDDCNTEVFANLRAQLWWEVRGHFEAGTIDIDETDVETIDELKSLRYTTLSSGKIQIESKEAALRRGVSSPNRADSIMLSFAPAEEKLREVRSTWGRRAH